MENLSPAGSGPIVVRPQVGMLHRYPDRAATILLTRKEKLILAVTVEGYSFGLYCKSEIDHRIFKFDVARPDPRY